MRKLWISIDAIYFSDICLGMERVAKGFILIMWIVMSVVFLLGCNRNFTEDDFSLTISVSSQTFYEGENIQAEIVFKNLTNREVRGNVMGNRALPPHIFGWYIPGFHAVVETPSRMAIVIEPNAVMELSSTVWTSELGNSFAFSPTGEYRLYGVASFNLGRSSRSSIFIQTEAIILTQIER